MRCGAIDNCKIFLNGEEQQRCIMADEEKGEIEQYVDIKKPENQLLLKSTGQIPTEIKTGVVKVELYKNGKLIKT